MMQYSASSMGARRSVIIDSLLFDDPDSELSIYKTTSKTS